MPSHAEFEIIFDDAVTAHFRPIDRQDRSAILDAIEQQLAFDPNVRTRNRKALRIPSTLNASWELRCGANNRHRVFYDVDVETSIVVVLAVGQKSGNPLFIGREELVL